LSLLIVIIYLAFISLGLPDSLMGAGWPAMHAEFDVPVSYAGIVTMFISGCTVVSSLLADRVTRKLGTGLVTAISVLMTAVALFGFSVAGSFWMLLVWAVPYGLGAGAIDTALNNYVAVHYTSRYMSWLHCFWGVGAAISPYIMGYALTGNLGWDSGYRIVSVIQIALAAVLFISLPLWRRHAGQQTDIGSHEEEKALTLWQTVRIRGVASAMLMFFAYCALEQTCGLWASSYLVQNRGIDVETAANFASLFYLGITFGRFLCGFITDRVGDRGMIRLGNIISLAGILLVLIPLPTDIPALAGLVIIGLGCAPVFPSAIHATPDYFGREHSQAVIGVQMASAYIGITFMPSLFGWISSFAGLGIYPVYMLFFALLLVFMSERVARIADRNNLSAK